MTADEEHDAKALQELAEWRNKVALGSGPVGRAAKALQVQINRMIPEKVHAAVTSVMEQMIRGVLTGSGYATPKPLEEATLREREAQVDKTIERYRTTASAEGGITGAGGFLMNMADFPILIGIKIKLLFDLAALYGHSTRDFQERLYILHVFELAFSSPDHRRQVFEQMQDWDEHRPERPTSFETFDWRRFQQEYRDYIDLAKLAQMLPIVGAPVGAVVNYRLLDQLGETAKNAYRMRWFGKQGH